jgi:thiol-disulfide isomerase/thioredoxin
MAEVLLASHLSYNLKEGYLSFDSLKNIYENKFPKSKYVRYIDSLYSIEKAKLNISLEDALLTEVQDQQGKKTALKTLLNSKPVIIDCWASWCIPCLQQMPFSRELEKQYSDKIDFIYLSFDKNQKVWLAKSQNLEMNKTSFLLTGNFNSKFAGHFDIISIPRYLIFDRNGKLFLANSPRPSKKEEMKKLMEELIK